MGRGLRVSVLGAVLGVVFVSGLAWGSPQFVRVDKVPQSLVSDRLADGFTGAFAESQSLSFSLPEFKDLDQGKVQLELQGGKHLFAPGMPEVPMLHREVAVPFGKKASVVLSNLVMDESVSKVSLPETPVPLIWSGLKDVFKDSFNTGNIFPGKWVRSIQSGGTLHVQLFPVQYNQSEQKVISLRSAEMAVVFESQPVEISVEAVWSNPGVILTSDALLPAAKKLQQFHRSSLGVESDIVTVESLDQVETAIDEADLPAGYKDPELRDDVVVPWDGATKTGYHYELARKITHYMQRRMNDGHTRYVTILGDALQVPPSYYFSVGSGFARQFGPTDQCYASTDQCMDPKLAVGRLALSTEEEVDTYLQKVTRWLRYSEKASHELSLYGGKAFPVDMYIGELGTMKVINSDKNNWVGLQKYFRTRKSYSKKSMMEMVSGKGITPFVYHLDHGNGNQWYAEKEYVSSTDILGVTESGPNVNPVVVSIACTDAAFEASLVKEPVLAGGKKDGEVAIGVSLLKSKGGAVAYLGSARPAVGNPIYKLDTKGNLILTGTTFGLQVMDTFYQKYHDARGGRLGDLVLQALRAYQLENGNDMTKDVNIYTYFNVTLLGDPVLRLPERLSSENNHGHAESTTIYNGKMVGNYPAFKTTGDVPEFELTFAAKQDVLASIVKIIPGLFGGDGGEEIVDKGVFGPGAKIRLKNKGKDTVGQYFVRLENFAGVPMERQVWFKVVE